MLCDPWILPLRICYQYFDKGVLKMADIKLFNIKGTVKEYQSSTVTLEKELQIVIENNMDTFLALHSWHRNTAQRMAAGWTA